MSWFDTREFGVVERVDDEAIATEFYTVILPVWPRASHYRTRVGDGEVQHVPIAHHPTSIAAGLARTPLWLAAFMLAAPSFAEPERWSELLALAIPLAVLASIVTFVIGRLPPAERARRRLLRRVVGIGAPPEMLVGELPGRVRSALEGEWRELSEASWPNAIVDGVAHELLVALAEYHGRHALAAQAMANLRRRSPARA